MLKSLPENIHIWEWASIAIIYVPMSLLRLKNCRKGGAYFGFAITELVLSGFQIIMKLIKQLRLGFWFQCFGVLKFV